jgi:hypothetical protein
MHLRIIEIHNSSNASLVLAVSASRTTFARPRAGSACPRPSAREVAVVEETGASSPMKSGARRAPVARRRAPHPTQPPATRFVRIVFTNIGMYDVRVFFTQKCKTDKGCVCKPGYIRKTDGGPCVPKNQCPPRCSTNEVYDGCYHDCENSCTEPAQMCTMVCYNNSLLAYNNITNK